MTKISEAAKRRACELANEAVSGEWRQDSPVWEPDDINQDYGTLLALARVLQEHSDVAKAALVRLTHHENCTSPFGYPEQCGCGLGSQIKPLQSLILPDEKPDPDEVLARAFHETYESLAGGLGYTTSLATREFDPATPNGKLMIATVKSLRERKIVQADD